MTKVHFATKHLKQYLTEGTVHSLPLILRQRWVVLRVFWVLITVGALVATIYFSRKLFVVYLEEQTLTSMRIQMQPNLTLPDVLLCPFNRIDERDIKRWGVDSIKQFIQRPFLFKNLPYGWTGGGNDKVERRQYRRLADGLYEAFDNSTDIYGDIMKYLFGSPSDVLLTCRNEGEVFDCWTKTEVVPLGFGLCWRVLGIVQSVPGFANGMQLHIRLPRPEVQTPGTQQLLNDGMMFSFVGNAGIENRIYMAPPGTYSSVQLKRTAFSFLNSKTFECHDQKGHVGNYSQLQCYQDCLYANLNAQCNCTLISQLSDGGRTCDPLDLECIEPLFQEAKKNRTTKCAKQCPIQCDYELFEPTITYANLSFSMFNHYAPKRSSNYAQDIIDYSLILDIHYDMLSTTVIAEHWAMTTESLVSNIGGTLGLWLGGSLLTLVHLIAFILECLLCPIEIEKSEKQNDEEIIKSKK